MLNMLGRLLKIKRHWTESGQQGDFPFGRALEDLVIRLVERRLLWRGSHRD
jgi:hypothetical protein